jgi:7-carboxy-7-deazaguanine synthase
LTHYSLKNLSSEQKSSLEKGLLLPVMEEFYSLQGEGYNTGKAAYFLRIGGCDIGCWWCDVKESWDASIHPLIKTKDIVERALDNPAKAIVITGGEPLMYNLEELCQGLKRGGAKIFIETSGAYALSGIYDWICLSPKPNVMPRKDMLLMADELKVVIHEPDDFEWAEQNAKMVKEKCILYLQPEWSQYKKVLPAIVDYVKNNPRWQTSLQAHKFMNIP